MDHSEDEIILPESESTLSPEPSPVHKSAEKKSRALAVVAIIAGLALVGSLVFIFIGRPTADDSSETADSSDSDGFRYPKNEFDEVYRVAMTQVETKDYYGAINSLVDYSLPERMTTEQKYRYNYLLADIYSETKINNPSLHDLYYQRMIEAHTKLLKGEE